MDHADIKGLAPARNHVRGREHVTLRPRPLSKWGWLAPALYLVVGLALNGPWAPRPNLQLLLVTTVVVVAVFGYVTLTLRRSRIELGVRGIVHVSWTGRTRRGSGVNVRLTPDAPVGRFGSYRLTLDTGRPIPLQSRSWGLDDPERLGLLREAVARAAGD